RIERSPQPHESIEQLHLAGAERLALEDASAHVPGRTGDAVEIDNPLDMEPGLLHLSFKLRVGVASKMTQRDIQGSKDLLIVRNKDNGTPAGTESGVDIS